MEQLLFVVPSIIFVHFLFLHHVLLVKMRILNSLDFPNTLSVSGCLKFAHDILVLRGTRIECHSMYFHIRAWHWSPRTWNRKSFGRKDSGKPLVFNSLSAERVNWWFIWWYDWSYSEIFKIVLSRLGKLSQPYHPGSGSYEQLFHPYKVSTAWKSRKNLWTIKTVYQRPITAKVIAKHSFQRQLDTTHKGAVD